MSYNIDKIRHEPPKIRIGKRGITENIIQEIKNVLKKDKVLKIKCLQVVPSESIKAIAENISRLTNSKVVEIRGKTIILALQP
jgi:RNA-binding protein